MATGRTVDKWKRIYVDGYDLSGNARAVGPLSLEYDEADLTTWTDSVKGYLKNYAQANLGTLNAVFDNTATTGIHAVLGTAGTARTVLVAQGIRGAPAQGDPAFGGTFTQSSYQVAEEGGGVTVSVNFSGWATNATTLLHAAPWGVLLHPLGTETVGNTGGGIDNGAATANGGVFVYHLTTSNGDVRLRVQHSVDDVNINYANLALSDLIDASVTPASGIVAVAPGTAVNQWLRWGILLGTATTVTFVSAFMRG